MGIFRSKKSEDEIDIVSSLHFLKIAVEESQKSIIDIKESVEIAKGKEFRKCIQGHLNWIVKQDEQYEWELAGVTTCLHQEVWVKKKGFDVVADCLKLMQEEVSQLKKEVTYLQFQNTELLDKIDELESIQSDNSTQTDALGQVISTLKKYFVHDPSWDGQEIDKEKHKLIGVAQPLGYEVYLS